MSYEVSGKAVFVGETQEVGANGFKKRELVVQTEGQYPQEVIVEFVQDKTDLLDMVLPNQNVKVNFNLRGRKVDSPGKPTRWFNSLQGWKIDLI